MITNERQYKITKAQLAKLKEGVNKFDITEASERIGSRILAKAELDGLISEVDILSKQLREYENLKSGVITNFKANSLNELHDVLIRARIAQQLSQRELGELVGLKEQQIQRYEAEKYASASLRRIQEIADALKLSIAEIAEINPTSKSDQFNWDKFPVKEMYKRGWFEGFSGSLIDLAQAGDELVKNFISAFKVKPSLALHRKSVRSGSQIDLYALLAWECRILDLASKFETKKEYNFKSITPEWISSLKKLSVLSDGPVQAKATLNDAGIILIIEPHLPGTHLDGAAMLLNGETPVIGLTLRHDRLDNFWFVLFHELFHIIKHLRKDKLEYIFDDLESEEGILEEIEKEADKLSSEALIPSDEWDKALPRYIQSSESVQSFSSRLGISPAIVAGRIRKESKNYTILINFIGQGEVRKHFPEVNFGT